MQPECHALSTEARVLCLGRGSGWNLSNFTQQHHNVVFFVSTFLRKICDPNSFRQGIVALKFLQLVRPKVLESNLLLATVLKSSFFTKRKFWERGTLYLISGNCATRFHQKLPLKKILASLWKPTKNDFTKNEKKKKFVTVSVVIWGLPVTVSGSHWDFTWVFRVLRFVSKF